MRSDFEGLRVESLGSADRSQEKPGHRAPPCRVLRGWGGQDGLRWDLGHASSVRADAGVAAKAGKEQRAVAPFEVLVGEDATQEDSAGRTERVDGQRPLDAVPCGDEVERSVYSRNILFRNQPGNSFSPMHLFLDGNTKVRIDGEEKNQRQGSTVTNAWKS